MLSPDRGAVEQQAGLAGVIQDQRREDKAEPGDADRFGADMTHVGVERLGAGDAQEDAAQQQEAGCAAFHQGVDGVSRIEAGENGGVLQDAIKAERADGEEPQRHDRAEQAADPGGAERLHRERAPIRIATAIGST